MECTTQTARFGLIVINGLSTITGLATVVLSGLAITALHHRHSTFSIFGIVVGITILFVSFFGCLAIKQNSLHCMQIHALLLLLLFVVQIIILINFSKQHFVKVVTDEVEKAWAKEINKPGYMSAMEQEFKCCGLYSWRDYHTANLSVPTSCYESYNSSDAKYVFDDGCWVKLAEVSKQVSSLVQSTNWCLTMLESIGLIFSCMLIYDFRLQGDYMNMS